MCHSQQTVWSAGCFPVARWRDPTACIHDSSRFASVYLSRSYVPTTVKDSLARPARTSIYCLSRWASTPAVFNAASITFSSWPKSSAHSSPSHRTVMSLCNETTNQNVIDPNGFRFVIRRGPNCQYCRTSARNGAIKVFPDRSPSLIVSRSACSC